MKSDYKATGRIIGVLLLAQILIAMPVFTEFGMMGTVTSPHFLTEAAAHATAVRIGVLLTYVLAAITTAVALVAFPLLRTLSERTFWLYFGLSLAGIATAALEGSVFQQMLAMSISHAQSANSDVYEALAPVVRSQWSTTHRFNLATGHLKVFIFFLILFRFKLIPRPLAGAGLLASTLSTVGVTATLAGVQFSYFMIAPAALIQFAMTLWLIWKGFSEPVSVSTARIEDGPS